MKTYLRRYFIRIHLLRALLALVVVYWVLLLFWPHLGPTASRALIAETEKEQAVGYDDIPNPAALIDALRRNETDEFEWADWVDMRRLDIWNSRDFDPKLFPVLRDIKSVNDIPMPLNQHTSQHEIALIGRLYLQYKMPAPRSIVPLPDPRVPISELPHLLESDKPYEEFKVFHKEGDDRSHHQHGQSDPVYIIPEHEPLSPDLHWNVSLEQRIAPITRDELFAWKISKQIKSYLINDDELDSASDQELFRHDHGVSLQMAAEAVQDSGKYFHEVMLAKDPLGYGTHYDWRFFHGVVTHEDHRRSISALVQAWAHFADLFGINYWFAHGSLLGWWWNSMSMPWDFDSDLQMPVQELDRLARDFNGTLVVQNTKDGNRSFYIDVGPWYVDRVKGNGNNVIDARFIDVHTGAYIDITGLAQTDGRTEVNCKNWHMYDISTLTPPKRILYEGAASYVPNKYNDILRSEYHFYDRPDFGKWRFNDHVKLWELEQTCDDYLLSYGRRTMVYCIPQDLMTDEECESSHSREIYDTCDRLTIKEHSRTMAMTSAHEDIKDLWDDWESNPGSQIYELAKLLSVYYPGTEFNAQKA